MNLFSVNVILLSLAIGGCAPSEKGEAVNTVSSVNQSAPASSKKPLISAEECLHIIRGEYEEADLFVVFAVVEQLSNDEKIRIYAQCGDLPHYWRSYAISALLKIAVDNLSYLNAIDKAIGKIKPNNEDCVLLKAFMIAFDVRFYCIDCGGIDNDPNKDLYRNYFLQSMGCFTVELMNDFINARPSRVVLPPDMHAGE